MGYIYAIEKNNKPVYVGQTIRNPQERWQEHKWTANRTNKYTGWAIHRAMRKYGIDAFTFKVLEQVDNSLLNEREKYWIAKLHTHISENGYNLTAGGESAPDVEKIICHQYDLEGNYIQSFNSIAEAARSVNGSYSNIIKVINNEIRSAYGFRWSKILYSKLCPLPDKYTGHAKILYQYDLNYQLINIFPSSREAARQLGKSQGNISAAASGKRKTAYGFIWSYKKLDIKG